MKVKQFNSRVEFSSNVYYVKDDISSFIVDPGFCDDNMINYIKNNGGLDFILLTHGHFDHFFGVEALLVHFPKAKVYIHYLDIDLLYDSKKNGLSLFMNKKIDINFEVNPLFEGENNINNIVFEVIHNPGHTNGSSSFYFKKENLLFVGDFLFATSIGRCDLFGGSIKLMNKSLEMFKTRKFSDELYIYTGHENNLKYDKLMKINPYLK